MNDKEIREDNACMRSDINVLEMMVKGYEEQGGGYSQKEALNTAIKFLSNLVAIKGSGVLPEKKERCPERDCIPFSFCGCRVETINKTIDEISLNLAKAMGGLQKDIGDLIYYIICEDGVSISLPPDLPEKLYCRKLSKAITAHIKTKLGLGGGEVMQKPRKLDKIFTYLYDKKSREHYKCGFNEACSAWEAFLPSEDEIHDELIEVLFKFKDSIVHQDYTVEIAEKQAKIIAKRIGVIK